MFFSVSTFCDKTGKLSNMKQVDIFTDGACSGNPGLGGWGAILRYKGVEKEISGVYKLRKDTRQLAQEKNRPVVYNRTAVMAVSVFHLSHWRCDVTVSNYLLA